jgi:hypothetical protein
VAYIEFNESLNETLRERYVDCFNYNAGTIEDTFFNLAPDVNQESLREGLVELDRAGAAECLRQLSQASCLDLLDNSKPSVCDSVIHPTVTEGGFCFGSADCVAPTHACIGDQSACGSSCQVAPTSTPAASSAEGETCINSTQCEPELFCLPDESNSLEGTCARFVPDQSCTGTWQCPWPFVCVEVESGSSRCARGRGDGDACIVRDLPRLNGWRDHDCAPTHDCVIEGGGSVGTCEAAASWRGSDPPSTRYSNTRSSGYCQIWPAEDAVTCGWGSFCDVDSALLDVWENAPTVDLLPALPGSCRPWAEAGEACDDRLPACRPASVCADRLCSRCQ